MGIITHHDCLNNVTSDNTSCHGPNLHTLNSIYGEYLDISKIDLR